VPVRLALGAAACSTYSTSAPAPAAPAQGGSGSTLGKVSEIEVGGGKVFTAEQVVVTQPCGHFQGVHRRVHPSGLRRHGSPRGTINCPATGSKFKAADGSVAAGPATSPLAAKTVAVQGISIVLG